MCWQLTVAGPPTADLPDRLRPFGGGPEPDAAVAALFPRGDVCRRVGAWCACDLYRADAARVDRVRRTAARRNWPEGLLRRRLAAVGDWTGLDPAVREAMAIAAERWGRAGLFLHWHDNAGRPAVADRRTVSPDDLRTDPEAVAPGRLLTVRTRGA